MIFRPVCEVRPLSSDSPPAARVRCFHLNVCDRCMHSSVETRFPPTAQEEGKGEDKGDGEAEASKQSDNEYGLCVHCFLAPYREIPHNLFQNR